MSIKADWINQFEARIKEDFPYITGDQPYQLATAYFNFATDGGAEETVDEAYARYFELQSQVPTDFIIEEFEYDPEEYTIQHNIDEVRRQLTGE